MSYRVLIRAFTLRRDIASAKLIAETLRRHHGCSVAIGCGRNFRRYLTSWRPHAVIVNVISCIPQAREQALPGAVVVHWPGEGANRAEVSDPHFLKVRGNGTGLLDQLDLFLPWGEFTRQVFIDEFGEGKADKAVACGNYRLDLLKYSPKSNLERRTVGFIGRFGGLNSFDRRPTIASLVDIPENVAKLQFMLDQFGAMLKLIDAIVKNTGMNISIRPHPLEAPEGYQRLLAKYPGRIEVDDSFDFAGWVYRQKAILSPASTSFIEPYLLKVPLINIDHLLEKENFLAKRELFTSYDGPGFKPRTLDETLDLIRDPALKAGDERFPKMESYLKDVHGWPSSESAIARGCAEIMAKLKERRFPALTFHTPKPLVDLADTAHFCRAHWLGGDYHANFQFCPAYHKFPAYYRQAVDNLLANQPQPPPGADPAMWPTGH